MSINDELVKALEFSESIVVLTDERGLIRYVNNSFEKKYGYTKAEVIGKKTNILRTNHHDELYYANLWQTLNSGQTWRGMFKNKTKSGQFVWENATISPVTNAKGIITGYIAVKEDITQKRKLELELDTERLFLDTLFNNSPVGIAILEPIISENRISDFAIVRANPTAGKVVGRLGVVGLKVSDILPEYDVKDEWVNLMISRKSSFESYFKDIGKFVRYRSFPFGKNKVCLFFYDVSHYKETIKALEASEERYFTLVEDAPALICRFNKKGILNYVNNQCCETFEVEHKQLIGQNFFAWFSSEESLVAQEQIKALTSAHPITKVEQKLLLGKGRVRWLHWLHRALINSEGEIYEYQSVGVDLTPLKLAELQLTHERNKLDAIVNSTVAGIGVVNRQKRFVLVNTRFCDLLAYDNKEELLELTYVDITHPDWMDEGNAYFSQLVNGEISDYNIEKKFLRKDKTFFWGDLHVSPIKDANGKVVEVIGVLMDISRKKEFALKLKESENKLRELNATKDILFSIIAHDIKNPFHSIIGFSSLLRKNLDSYSKSEIKEYIEHILMASESVFKMLDDLLIWARNQLGQMTVNPIEFDVYSLINEAFASFGLQAKNKGVNLVNEVKHEHVVNADFDMFKFVVRNLVHNGIKFTHANDEVRCYSYTIDNYVVLSITDTGIGIRPEKLKVLFDFGKSISTSGTSEEKGTGLGLHLSKELVEKNGGKLLVKSQVGKGTEFLVYIPL